MPYIEFLQAIRVVIAVAAACVLYLIIVALCSETSGDVEDSGCTWNGEEADVPDTDL